MHNDQSQPAAGGPADQTPDDLVARVGALEPMLADPDPRVRKSAVIALGRMACPQATAALCRALADRVEGVRVLACQALARLADPACLPDLLGRTHDESTQVRAGVLWALANVAAHGGVDDATRRSLFTPVVVLAFDPDDGVRADAAAVLGSLRDERASEALSVLLEDDCSRVRANACASLGLLDDEAGLDLLLGVLGHDEEDPLVLVSAIDGVARRAERGTLAAGSDVAVRAVALLCGLTSGDVLPGAPNAASQACDRAGADDVRSTAVWALGFVAPLVPTLRPDVQNVLEGALAHGSSWSRRYAVESLARIHDDSARATLAGLLEAETRGSDGLAGPNGPNGPREAGETPNAADGTGTAEDSFCSLVEQALATF